MRVMVTGASGRLGRVTLDLLADRGIESLAFSGVNSANPTQLVLDLTRPAEVDEHIARFRPNAVIHLGAITGARCDTDSEATRIINVESSATLAAMALSHGAQQFVFASTAAVYGTDRLRPVSESDEALPASAYGVSKLGAERALEKIARTSNLSVTSLRFFNIFGDGFADSLVAALKRSTSDAPVRLHGWDHFVRDYIHGSDAAAAIMAALDHPGAGSRVINVGRGVPVSNADLVTALSAQQSVYYETVGDITTYSCARVDSLRELLGFRATRFP